MLCSIHQKEIMPLTASTIMMIRPNAFGFNDETATSNAFQQRTILIDNRYVTDLALKEFDLSVNILMHHNIEVLVFDDTSEPQTPDAVFPNNWISVHADGTMILYPMMAMNRRSERRKDIVESLQSKFCIHTIHDLAHHETEGRFLEGTGSIVFDHQQKIAFAAISERTHAMVFRECCELLGYQPITFRAFHEHGLPVYHTNVLMHVNPLVSALCIDMIFEDDRSLVMDALIQNTQKPIILSAQQVNNFAGNMLVILNSQGTPFLIGSKRGFDSLTKEQMRQIPIDSIQLDIPTIETIGGGSARCMMAEIHSSPII